MNNAKNRNGSNQAAKRRSGFGSDVLAKAAANGTRTAHKKAFETSQTVVLAQNGHIVKVNRAGRVIHTLQVLNLTSMSKGFGLE